MRALLLGLVGLLLAPAAAAQDRPCPPVPGIERLWAKPDARFVIFGEYHGTAETPALFADVVCHAAATGRRVLVGVEYFEEEQPALDRFMSGADRTYGEGRTFRHDGRRSAAMFQMLERLRALKQAGRPLEVFAFVRESERGHNQTPHEQAMAAAWRDKALANPDALLLILVGNIHALKDPKGRELSFVPAAALLPPESTLSLLTTIPEGDIWACRGTGCGAGPLAAFGGQLPRGVHLAAEPGMDGRFSVGTTFTASPPASGTAER